MSPKYLLLASALLFATRLLHAADPELIRERSTVLTSKGNRVDRNLPLYPLRTGGLGRVFAQGVKERGARKIRVHFVIEQQPVEPTWGVQILDDSGIVRWSKWAGEVIDNDFWSDEILGDSATVEVYSVEPDNSVRLTIDALSAIHEVSVDLSITGRNDLTSIAKVAKEIPWVGVAGSAVARILFQGDDGGWYYCTGFLLTPDLLVTNQHCLATPTEARSAYAHFDFDSKQASPKSVGVRKLEAWNYELDYSLVRLVKAMDRTPLEVGGTPHEPEELVIIQHPGGEPKQVSVIECRVDGASREGRHRPNQSNQSANPTDFGHSCDTKKGSSGSPVFDRDLKTVVGLHHLAFDGSKLYNRAVWMSLILEDIRKQWPGLLPDAPTSP